MFGRERDAGVTFERCVLETTCAAVYLAYRATPPVLNPALANTTRMRVHERV
jgi:hypothetical protein